MTAPDPVSREELEAIATRVLYELLGRRWVWPEVTTTEYHPVSGGQRVVRLEGRPVRSVESARFEGSGDELAVTIESGHVLRLPRTYVHPLCSGGSVRRLVVRYSYGSEPPLEVTQAIRVLADELAKSVAGDPGCRLPQRVTSVTRQGITMTILDSQEFLDQGKTGIPEVDAAIRHFNPGQAKRPARVIGRMTPPSTRVDTIQARTP